MYNLTDFLSFQGLEILKIIRKYVLLYKILLIFLKIKFKKEKYIKNNKNLNQFIFFNYFTFILLSKESKIECFKVRDKNR